MAGYRLVVFSLSGLLLAGEVRPLAVTTSTRAEALPKVPAIAETVPGYEASTDRNDRTS